ncbi:PAQR family membrane homeostasis protein TrhA [Companilactobacillus bobalius]|uniref:Hemolysin III n=2 Tax=Companilactobacillus bobalius TaxID=2801451 RepID=A0A0R1KN13_9LACO|nr:hemolysin III family protein [Companilactobacillus bobalius]KAE9562543.1 hemolysin III [Companilactobacillus bobalius]KRK81538.1 hemolysin III [Companilactobacillus bobalius DSM 19674]
MMKISRRYSIRNEVFSALTHGIGIVLSLLGFIFLIRKANVDGSLIEYVSFIIYGISLCTLYTFSTLFHSLYFTKAREVFRVFDHSSIYILIAGSYTPFSLLVIKGWLGISMIIVIWILAIMGIVINSVYPGKLKKVETIIYIFMGWLCILGGKQIWNNLGSQGFFLLLFGGISFTLGAILYSLNGIKYAHVIWHIFVLIGTMLMFFSIYLYI